MADIDASFAKLDKERLIELSFLPDGARTFRGDKSGFLMFLNSLRKEGDTGFCDVNLEVEGATFPAHRCVLAANSQFFYTMFTSGMRDSNQKQIKLCSLTSAAMTSILDFFYTREINIGKDNVVDILEAASFLLLSPIKMACSQIIMSSLRSNNCISTKRLADKYALEDLKNKADAFIKKNFQEVKNEGEVLELTLGELCELASSDDLNVETEEEVFNAVVNWVKHDPQTRAAHLSTIMPCLRFGSLSAAFMEEQIEKEPILQQCPFCQNFLKQQQRRRRSARANKGSTSKERPSAKVHNIVVGVGRGNLRTSFCYDTDSDHMYKISDPYSPSFVLGVAVIGREVYCVCRDRHDWEMGASMLLKYPLDQSNKSMFSWSDMAGCNLISSSCNEMTNLIALKGRLYIVGGCSGGTLGGVQCYNPVENVWSFVASLTHPRCQVGAVGTGNYMYVAGGAVDHPGTPERFVERYNPDTNSWSSISPLKSRRASPMVVANSTSVFVIGGTGHPGLVQVTCEVYKEASDHWSTIAPLPQGWKTTKVITTFKEEVYVVGRGDIWRYESKKNNWKKSSKLKSLKSGFEDFHMASLQLPKFCFQHRSKTNTRNLANYDKSIYDCSSDEDDEESLMDYAPPWFLWGDDSSGSDW